MMPMNEKQPLYTASLHKEWNNHRLMHEKVGVKQHWLTPHSRKWGVSWPPWPLASAVYGPHLLTNHRPLCRDPLRRDTSDQTQEMKEMAPIVCLPPKQRKLAGFRPNERDYVD